jgi:hypothetical protein
MIRESFLEFMVRHEINQRIRIYGIYDDYYHGAQIEALTTAIANQLDDPISSIVNYCKAVVDIATRYIAGTASRPNSLSIDVNELQFIPGDKEGTGKFVNWKTNLAYEAQRQLNRIYKASGMFDTEFAKLVRTLIKKGDSFMELVLVGDDEESRDIRIKVKRPDVVYPRYHDDDYMEMMYCAVKWFQNVTPRERNWYAKVHHPQTAEMPATTEIYDLGTQSVETDSDRQWNEDDDGTLRSSIYRPVHVETGGAPPEKIDSYDSAFPQIPIYHLKNNTDDLEFGVSDLQPVKPLQDDLNRIYSDMLYALDYNGFPRGFVFGAQGNTELDVGPAIWTKVPDPSGNVMVIPPANIGHFIQAIDLAIDMICGVSSTPKQALAEYAHSLPASGYALRVRYQPLEDKCNEKRAELKMGFRRMNTQILYLLEQMGALPEDASKRLEVDVHFGGGLPADKLTDAQLYGMYKQSGWMSDQTIMERLEIENPEEELAQIRQERYEEAVLYFQAEQEAAANTQSGTGSQEE